MRFLPSWDALTGSARGKEQLAGEGHVFLSLSGISPHTAFWEQEEGNALAAWTRQARAHGKERETPSSPD